MGGKKCRFYNKQNNISPRQGNVESTAAPLAFLFRLSFEFRVRDATRFKWQKALLRLVRSRAAMALLWKCLFVIGQGNFLFDRPLRPPQSGLQNSIALYWPKW